jgi:murein DD-endopeptidase MepM/ murein hydrolase activator NlpD
MRLAAFLLLSLFSSAYSFSGIQHIEIDTSLRLLQSTPDYTPEEALKAHKELEKQLKKGQIDLYNEFYLLFRYRDDSFILTWLKVLLENPSNPLLRVWFINAVEQMGNPKNVQYIAPFKDSRNAIIRECAANAFGFLAPEDSIPMLTAWLSNEKNEYVCKTIEASIAAIRKGGYKSRIPYLPQYYSEKPLKITFLYNRKINDDARMQYSEIDTSSTIVKCKYFSYPHQQYLWKLKNAQKAGFFGSHHGAIFHIGVDSGWLLEGLPVHAISDGIIKQISHNLSWGNLLVVETIDTKGDTISIIYGHLSPFSILQIGDTVHQGDRLGQIGNSVTPDNGGYWAHLHMGIEKRPFYRADISGYDTDTTNYENPITFIRENAPDSFK